VDVATLTALVAMVISVIAAAAKVVDKWRARRKEQDANVIKQSTVGAERDSIVVRGAEGALLLMEKTMHTASTECDKRIEELEEENEGLKCELLRMRKEIEDSRAEVRELRQELKELTTRVRRVE
jgi:chromosome segregation ATPase